MSQCIRTGVSYKRHCWQRGTCARCGESQSKENFSHELPIETEAAFGKTALQAAVISSLIAEGECGCCGKPFVNCDCASSELDRDI